MSAHATAQSSPGPVVEIVPHYGKFPAAADSYRRAGKSFQIEHGFFRIEKRGREWTPYLTLRTGVFPDSEFTADDLEEIAAILLRVASEARTFKPDRRLKRQDRYLREYRIQKPAVAAAPEPILGAVT